MQSFEQICNALLEILAENAKNSRAELSVRAFEREFETAGPRAAQTKLMSLKNVIHQNWVRRGPEGSGEGSEAKPT